jgi:hypothetical protein
MATLSSRAARLGLLAPDIARIATFPAVLGG